jgi:hypothetical protein
MNLDKFMVSQNFYPYQSGILLDGIKENGYL